VVHIDEIAKSLEDGNGVLAALSLQKGLIRGEVVSL
jgi:hypothetical protein